MTSEQIEKLLEKHAKAITDHLDRRLNRELAANYGQTAIEIGQRIDELEQRLNERIDGIYGRLDGIAKRLDDDEQERTATVAELERHKGWIGQLAEGTGTELAPEQ